MPDIDVGHGRYMDIAGKRFGKLVVIKYVGNNKHQKSQWLCKCDCGNTAIVVGTELRQGHTKSCGCIHLQQMYSKFNTKHGLCSHRIHGVWNAMKERCLNPKDKSYKNYGARGIKVCPDWVNNFKSFYDWAMQNGYDENAKTGKCTLDRIDNNGNYEPSNCRWVDNNTQQKNTRRNRLITYQNKTQCLTDWANELNIKFDVLKDRLGKLNWSVEKAFTTEVRKCRI